MKGHYVIKQEKKKLWLESDEYKRQQQIQQIVNEYEAKQMRAAEEEKRKKDE